jgi:molybdate transport system substrate-binding protein
VRAVRAARSGAVILSLALLLGSCGDDRGPAEATGEVDGTLRVLAASSLRDAFEDVEAAFEAEHPGVDVHVTTDGSANLATAIIEGGVPADVFASADEVNLQRVSDAGLAASGTAEAFTTNRLQIAVGEGNPLGISALAELTDPRLALSLCKEPVPCGRYAREAFEAAGLPVPPAGLEEDVGGVVTKVSLGEADAGLVYVTDVLAADDDLDGVDLEQDEQVVATYPAAVLTEAPNPDAAQAFVAFLATATAQEILEGYGFGRP